MKNRDVYFGVYIDKELLMKFRNKINRNYYRGKLKNVVEEMIKKFLNEDD